MDVIGFFMWSGEEDYDFEEPLPVEFFSACLRCFMMVSFPTDLETTICSISPVTLLDTF